MRDMSQKDEIRHTSPDIYQIRQRETERLASPVPKLSPESRKEETMRPPNGFYRGVKNTCLIYLVLGVLILLIVTQCSCMSATLPVEPAPAVLVEVAKGVSTPVVIYTSTPELIREVCPHVGNVNLRKAADSESDILAVLKMGDHLTLTGDFEKSPDGGIWWPVRAGEFVGYINARYVCLK